MQRILQQPFLQYIRMKSSVDFSSGCAAVLREEIRMIKPAVALRGVCVLPEMSVNFDISRDISIAAVEKAMRDDQQIFLVTQRDMDNDNPDKKDLYEIGVAASILQILKMPQGYVKVVVQGEYRARLINITSREPYIEAEIAELENKGFEDDDVHVLEAKTRILKQMVSEYSAVNPNFNERTVQSILRAKSIDRLITMIPNEIPMSTEQRQAFLELDTADEKYSFIAEFLNTEIEISEIRNKILGKVNAAVEKNQRDYYLREQIKAIHEELGDDMGMADADEYAVKLEKLKAPKEVKDKISREIGRLRAMPLNSNDAMVGRNYIDCMFEMPWSRQGRDSRDIGHAREILETQHYGLSEVKERVLDYIAVKVFSGNNDAPILCLAGPPGTGKTSIAKSIAEALNKKYVRVCLGGVSDEAEIRGHRKTYVGAMPGRIANALKQAGVNNPLMLLDEIDKTGSNYRGDVSAALLEVLDSEQNRGFRDNYLEVPVDLSNVFFIATANDAGNIPKPLLDRMEIINVESYTENEKFHIAKDYLIKKQMKMSGLAPETFSISDAAVMKVIREYTREAGVRNLERELASICRRAVRELLEGGKSRVRVSSSTVERYLGKRKVFLHKAEGEASVGVVNGLAWTSAGGSTMEIEASLMPSGSGLKLTGQLGDVMKESAMVAYTFVKSVASKYGIDGKLFEEHEIHVHVPEGAVPKDGPSAGIALVTVIMSCAADIKVKPYLAMTGEVTIRGRALPIGGLKEKLLGAKAAGITEVILPELNRKDIGELSEEVTGGLKLHYVNDAEEVLKLALLYDKKQ